MPPSSSSPFSKATKSLPPSYVYDAMLHPSSPSPPAAFQLLDTIHLSNSSITSWSYTSSSSGLVKTFDPDPKTSSLAPPASVLSRFRQVALSPGVSRNPHDLVAVFRHTDGSTTVYTDRQFEKVLGGQWPPADASVVMVQPYVPGRARGGGGRGGALHEDDGGGEDGKGRDGGTSLGGQMYRNSYSLLDDFGRTKTSTHSYRILPTTSPSQTMSSTSSSSSSSQQQQQQQQQHYYHQPSSSLQVSKVVAPSITVVLDRLTLSVVRFLESQRLTRVVRLWLDYTLDDEERGPVITNVGGIVTCNVADLRAIAGETGIKGEEGIRRTVAPVGFLGEGGRIMDEMEVSRKREEVVGGGNDGGEGGGGATPIKRKNKKSGGGEWGMKATQGISDDYKDTRSKDEIRKIMEQQILVASANAERQGASSATSRPGLSSSSKSHSSEHDIVPKFGGGPGPLPSVVPPPRPNSQESLARALGGRPSPGHHKGPKANPTAFRCHGDFCELRTYDPPALASDRNSGNSNKDRENALNIARSVLSKGEVDSLSASGLLQHLGVMVRDPLNFKAVSQKSILKARQENRQVSITQGEDMDAWKHYPKDPMQSRRIIPRVGDADDADNPSLDSSFTASSHAGDVGGGDGGERRGLHQQTETSKGRLEWSKQHGEVTGGAANYYKEVKVCGICAMVYSLLDQSRELIVQEEEKKAAEEKKYDKSDYSDGRARPKMTQSGPSQSDRQDAKGVLATELGRQLFSLSLNNPLGVDGTKPPPPLTGAMGDEADDVETTFLSPVRAGKASSKTTKQNAEALRSPSLPKLRATWKDHIGDDDPTQPESAHKKKAAAAAGSTTGPHEASAKALLAKGNDPHFEVLDDYLKGTKRLQHTVEGRKAEQLQSGIVAQKMKNEEEKRYHAKILIGDPNKQHAMMAREALEPSGYVVNWVENGADCIELMERTQFDAVLLAREMPVINAFEVTRWVRAREKAKRVENARIYALGRAPRVAGSFDKKDASSLQAEFLPPDVTSLPVVIFTDAVSPADLKSYMEAGMDGCVSKPLDPPSLVSTMKTAIPDHLAPLAKVMDARGMVPNPNKPDGTFVPANNPKMRVKPREFISGYIGTEDPKGSSAIIKSTLAMATDKGAGANIAKQGVIQYDSDTSFVYAVLDASTPGVNPGNKMFNMIVCHDLFDTLERLQVFFRPIVQRYPGIQILLWNYAGQAFTQFKEEQILNNDYHAACLSELIEHVGPKGTNQFNTSKPYYLLGFGNGASIASFFAAHYKTPSLRSLLFMNGFTFVDPHYAAILHDCMNVFSCSPDTRPDLPVYFYARFIFSPAYLSQVSTPLALNLYTAVHNPITIKGRIQLCMGALSNVDVRPFLKEIHSPIITVHGTQAGLCKPFHAQPWVETRPGGEARSIFSCLKSEKLKTCVIWVKGGHEVFQEQRTNISTLVEQLLTGYHELNDVAFMSENAVERGGAKDMGSAGTKNTAFGDKKEGSGANFEDNFVNSLMSQVNKVSSNASKKESKSPGPPPSNPEKRWEEFSEKKQQEQRPKPDGYLGRVSAESSGKKSSKKGGAPVHDGVLDSHNMPGTVTNPAHPSFERQDNSVYKAGTSLLYPNPEQFPEVKEYMSWRLKRNKKRLVRLESAAKKVQGAFRAHLAWIIVRRLREESASINIQRVFRGWRGRLRFLEKLKELWAAQVIQRTIRGYLGRNKYKHQRFLIAAQVLIAALWRGALARVHVGKIKARRHKAACKMQGLWRKKKARELAFKRRIQRNATVIISRVYRGHLGRRRAQHERDKYLFSRSQSTGIEFGRQMLLEHKLHATRLQSEVALLNQEKVTTEERVESLLDEISEFEEGVRALEKEMHSLSKVETEASGVLDQAGKQELRDQKIRLDREFGIMLTRIADRKDQLKALEGSLSKLDRARQGKEEELRILERKLVVLLEEQQSELGEIRRRQEKKGEALLKGELPEGGALVPSAGGAGAGAGRFVGPTAHEKKQAAQLMQSTETLMKFGFMSMSMTYFSSLNMVRAMRTVAAQDTVMAALSDNQNRGGGGGGGGGLGGAGGRASAPDGLESEHSGFVPNMRPGTLPGQADLRVQAWSVSDVIQWLVSLSLGQYSECFRDGAIDGAFLYALTDEDLRNTLGVEHRLHRKKIIFSIEELKRAEALKSDQLRISELADQAKAYNSGLVQDYRDRIIPGGVTRIPGQPDYRPEGDRRSAGDRDAPSDNKNISGVDMNWDTIASWVRNQKYKKLKEILNGVPNKRFDPSLVQVQYVEDLGTAYVTTYDRLPFHLNKVDQHGNTLLHISAQNGNLHIAKLLLSKGSNSNHQNHAGQTPGHFAIAYQFYDYSAWLFDPEGAGADDTLCNADGLTPYDGLSGADEEQEAQRMLEDEKQKEMKALKKIAAEKNDDD